MSGLVDFRAEEFNRVKNFFCGGLRVLEIGGGNGYQASLISAMGASVVSIDVVEPSVCDNVYFPVRVYDGQNLPFPDNYFDVVFSSNVLEHIGDLRTTLREIHRVLKPDGRAIHILPTPAWRVWTSLSHYMHVAQRVVGKVVDVAKGQHMGHMEFGTKGVVRRHTVRHTLMRVLGIAPHGEYSSAISELWYFSRRRWLRLFEQYGFCMVDDYPGGVFYTGHGVFPSLSLQERQKLARALGSATRVYVLRIAHE